MTEGNYTENDAIVVIAKFDVQNKYPEGRENIILWERNLVIYAMNQAHSNGYTQREEGL